MKNANNITVIVDIIEQLLIELACDEEISTQQLLQSTDVVMGAVPNHEAQLGLMQRIEICQAFYQENPNYAIILNSIRQAQYAPHSN